MEIREARLEDIEALVPLFDAYRQFYQQTSNLPLAKTFLRERLEQQQSVIFLASDEEEPCGFTQLYPSFSSTRAAPILILNDLYVIPRKRRLGIARALLAAVEQYARKVGAVRLTLSTAVDNEHAQATYDDAGWARDDKFFTYHLRMS